MTTEQATQDKEFLDTTARLAELEAEGKGIFNAEYQTLVARLHRLQKERAVARREDLNTHEE